jgi:YesN/AraC family two-component response regulator
MNTKQPKMLLIDDQTQATRWYLSLFSEEFYCITANSGEEGLIAFDYHSPKIVLCDVKLSKQISGFDICRKIKSTSPKTIVILVTSYNNTNSRIKGLESRADDYIDKMINEREFKLKVRNSYLTKYEIPTEFLNIEKKYKLNSFEEKVKSIIHDYYKNSIPNNKNSALSLEYLSTKINKSCRSIQRGFLKETNCKFSSFHRKIRLKIACDLLLDDSNSIAFISEYLCYSSPSIFSRDFKETHGVTPSKYRLNNNYK